MPRSPSWGRARWERVRPASRLVERLPARQRGNDDVRSAAGEGIELAPQPGLGDLAALLEQLARAGLSVDLQIDGQPVPLPRALDLSAYRIVQEGLTNALKHGRASTAEVLVRYRPDELQIEVRNDANRNASDGDGQGYGLVGVREGVRVYGGEMSARTVSNGSFVLTTRLPLRGNGS